MTPLEGLQRVELLGGLDGARMVAAADLVEQGIARQEQVDLEPVEEAAGEVVTAQRNADSPVNAWPITSWCTSAVPS